MTETKFFEILTKWNIWGKTATDAGFTREITADILTYLEGPEIIALKGIRRAGKSTIMFQIINALILNGISPDNILYINFEEPLFAGY